MGFDRSQWRIQGCRGFGVGQAAAVAERDADPFEARKRLQGLIQVDAVGRSALRNAGGIILLGRLGHDVHAGVAAPALDVEPGGDAFDPSLEGAFPAELRDLLEGGQEGVLGKIVGQRRIGAHPAQQRPHRRTMPAHQLAEGGPAARPR